VPPTQRDDHPLRHGPAIRPHQSRFGVRATACPRVPSVLRCNWTMATRRAAMFTPDQNRQQAVFDRLRQGILSGTLPTGARLPPTRALAEELGVARQTVVLAYERLASEGYVRARTGSGTYVAAELPDAAPAPAMPPPT